MKQQLQDAGFALGVTLMGLGLLLWLLQGLGAPNPQTWSLEVSLLFVVVWLTSAIGITATITIIVRKPQARRKQSGVN